MKHSPEEILKALHVIKDECRECGGGCAEKCPFTSAEGDCLITYDSPYDWDINDDSITIWKGLL